jgi:hypothetical protein
VRKLEQVQVNLILDKKQEENVKKQTTELKALQKLKFQPAQKVSTKPTLAAQKPEKILSRKNS